jgi:hypothetical protein
MCLLKALSTCSTCSIAQLLCQLFAFGEKLAEGEGLEPPGPEGRQISSLLPYQLG